MCVFIKWTMLIENLTLCVLNMLRRVDVGPSNTSFDLHSQKPFIYVEPFVCVYGLL